MEHSPASLSAYWRLVHENRNFRLLWFAQIVSELGDWLYSIAIYSLLLELTGSAKSLATAIVLQTLPQFFVAPGAGVVSDRISRKRVMILADLARAVIVVLMLAVRSREWVGLIYVLLFIETTMWAFFEPARNAVIPNITRGSELLTANTLSASTWSVIMAAGFSIGGVVAVLAGRSTVFVINTITFLVSASLIRAMRFDEPHVAAAAPLRARDLTDFTPLVEGLRYVAGDRRLLALLLVKAGLGVMGANLVILPVLGERTFPVSWGGLDGHRAGMLGMSILTGARGLGALLGPLIGGRWAAGTESRLLSGILYGFLAGAAGYLALGFSTTLLLAVAVVVLAHAGGSVIWVFSTTLLQDRTDDRFRGRVFSADYAFHVVTMSLVCYLAGVLVDHGIGAKPVAMLTGALTLGPALAWALALRLWKPPAAPSIPDHRNH